MSGQTHHLGKEQKQRMWLQEETSSCKWGKKFKSRDRPRMWVCFSPRCGRAARRSGRCWDIPPWMPWCWKNDFSCCLCYRPCWSHNWGWIKKRETTNEQQSLTSYILTVLVMRHTCMRYIFVTWTLDPLILWLTEQCRLHEGYHVLMPRPVQMHNSSCLLMATRSLLADHHE